MNYQLHSKILWRFSIIFLNILAVNNAFGQLILNQANTTGTYTAPHTIELSNGFSSDNFSGSITPNCVPLGISLTNNQNYIVTYTPRVAGITNPADPNNTTCDVMATVQYIDGLGRPMQIIQVKGSPTLRDIVTPIAYDQFGRENTTYDPFSALPINSNGSFKVNGFSDQMSFYSNPSNISGWNAPGVKKNNFPFAETAFEASPLNRPIEQGAPGDNWQLTGKTGTSSPGHTVKMDYTTNDASSSSGNGRWAKMYRVSYDSNDKPYLVDGGSYGGSQLLINIFKDENWQNSDGNAGTTEEYKDKQGNTVLNRSYNTGGVAHSTYYVFDDFGNLAFVLPASADPDNGAITQATLDKFCYQYRYDERQRLIEKKIPGKGREYIIYNKIDQVVATQDSLKRINNQWAFVKYDAFGKPVVTGIWNNGGVNISRIDLQTLVNSQTSLWERRDNTNTGSYYYTSTTFPTNNISKILTVNYYDDYSVPNLPSAYDKHAQYSQMTNGLLTVSLTSILDNSDLLWSAHYYDNKANIVKTIAQHYVGGTTNYNTNNFDEIKNSYDFTNTMITSIKDHHNGSNPLLTIIDSLAYDHTGRKIEEWKKINGGTNILVAKFDYNEIGQLKTKSLHSADGGASFLQNLNYTYNERGWMVKDSAALFVFQLKYNDGTVPQFNGNIADQYWGTGSNLTKNYSYSYDKMNRLLSGISNENFTESNISYDKTGNLQTLTRVDPRVPATYNYTYGYDGNHLLNVTGLTANNYQYDGNGNASYDAHNNAYISYNILNLPSAISGSKTISYTYDADGNKLRRTSANTTFGTVDYDNGIHYFNGVIDYLETGEGIARRKTDGSFSYEYTLTDNLGNSRVSFNDSSHVARIIQKDDYYPYGLNYNRYAFGTKNDILYNKKELQEEMGQYDYGARFYDPTIGRFLVIDKYAEKFQGISTYQYAALNPIKNIDMNGDSVWTTSTRVQHGKDVTETRTIHITGKVLDAAGVSSVRAGELAASLNDRYNAQTATDSYKNNDGGTTHITYNVDAKFEAASSINDVKNSDHLVAIVDQVTGKADPKLGGGDAVGVARLNGKISYVEATGSLKGMTDIAFHEVGHNMGFDHPNANSTSDPMSYTGQGANFSNKQVIDIYYNASSGMLNQGANRAIITNKQNRDSDGNQVSRSYSTQSHPYVGNRRYGMLVPLPIADPSHK
ncbi:RHS repeat-associated core domain-containing protein [Mucilaginibacter sp. HMF5004]|uniref:DUF6443 domain-containing protein n=1 Tax=Mucilaginibacter rivuli TaxID=2857527 RepID=UPI001C5F77B3|nr:DUF6443 domain-containing protein [Mucilaginibacter rivuli]MBW4889217.1 RHS repeat-associated core domain-containing protein [Mucilaginibacter rivuli]